jgi:hypothetical protein
MKNPNRQWNSAATVIVHAIPNAAALNQWPPNQKGLGDRAWQCNDGVRAVGD